MGFDWTKDLELYAYIQEKADKSWVLGELKIWIVVETEKKDGVSLN